MHDESTDPGWLAEDLRLLAERNPDLPGDALADAYAELDGLGAEDFPRPYTEAEQQAHAIVTAYLRHVGAEWWDGTDGELTPESRADLMAKLHVSSLVTLAVESDDDASEPVVMVPISVFHELMADFLMMFGSINDRQGGERGSLMGDAWLDYVQLK